MNNDTDKAFIQILSIQNLSVNNNGTIELNLINNSSGDIMIDDSNTIVVNRAGLYFITWWANSVDDNVVVSLLRNDNMEVVTSSNSPSKVNAIKGNAIIPIKAGEEFIFANDSGKKINIAPGRSAISMNISIVYLEEMS